jgi:hypothetical protein
VRGQRPPRPAPAVIRRYEALCEDCPAGRVQSFYSEKERNRFSREHVLTYHHRVTLSEKRIPWQT